MTRAFLNQKLGKRNSRRASLAKAKAYSRPSAHAPRASNPSAARPRHGRA